MENICAGLEEEGVPYLLRQSEYVENSPTPLQVKIWVEKEMVKVYHDKLPNKPYITEKVSDGRLLGKNAARLVKGLPLAFY